MSDNKTFKKGDIVKSWHGGRFRVWYVNPNGSYYCALLGEDGKVVYRCQYGRSYPDPVTTTLWGYTLSLDSN